MLDLDALILLEKYMNMIRRGEMLPTNDDWKKVTLQHMQERPSRVMLDCDDCGHRTMMWPDAFAEKACIPMATPLFIIAQHLQCGACGSRNVGISPEPHSTMGALRGFGEIRALRPRSRHYIGWPPIQ